MGSAVAVRALCHHAWMTFDQSWLDRTSSWWAKADRAHNHLRSLDQLVAKFRASEPYTVVPWPTDIPGRTEYRPDPSGTDDSDAEAAIAGGTHASDSPDRQRWVLSTPAATTEVSATSRKKAEAC